ncbi:MAG: hypothetical protein QOJ14_2253 [Thermoleophilaceae bacterium]|nr:hypothetical protein [Thermoleophilaceae bacterium]
MSTATRDLASHELWDRSLDRSRRRRVLAEDARKTISRRRQASLAVSAAMATTPVIPSVIAGAMNVTGKDTKTTRTHKPDTGQRILLKRGAVSPSVATLQRRLNVPDDGFYGPVTEKAVKKFQKKHHLAATGMVDVKTWLKLFPDGMVIYAPHSGVAQLAAQAPQNTLRGASAQSGAGVASVSAASAKAAKKAKSHRASLKKASAGADVLPSGSGSGSSVGIPASSGSSGGSSGSSGGGPVGGGSTVVPSGPFTSASEMIAAMIAAANRIDQHHYAYSWGGGHNASFSGPYDCSGAVSAVLHAAGLLNRPMVSGEFTHWGRPGSGAVTIYANAGHVYMSILGHFFGTTHANPGGGAGWFAGAARPGFVVVHVPFESMRFSKAQVRRAITKVEKRNRHDSVNYASVTPGFSGQAPGTTAAGTTQSGGMQSASEPQQSGYSAAAAPQQTQAATTASTYDTSGTAQASGGAPAPSSAPAASSGSSSGLSGGATPSAGTSAGSASSGSAGYSGTSSGAATSASSSGSSSGVGAASGSSSGGYSGGGSASSGSSSSGSSGSTPGLKDEATSTASSAGSAASSAGSSASSAAAPAESAASGTTSSGSSGSGSGDAAGQ